MVKVFPYEFNYQTLYFQILDLIASIRRTNLLFSLCTKLIKLNISWNCRFVNFSNIRIVRFSKFILESSNLIIVIAMIIIIIF